MKLALFSAKHYDTVHFNKTNSDFNFDIDFFDSRLTIKTAKLSYGCEVVCAFVNDDLDREVLTELTTNGTKLIAMRCAGFNNVDLEAAKELGLTVVRVPAYSPEATAEHSVALMMTLNRKIHKAYQRTRDANFTLDGLVGFNMFGKTVGVIGTGKIGLAAMRILKGFGCRLIAHDPFENPKAIELGVKYVDLDSLFVQSDIVTLHCPLTEDNQHLLNRQAFEKMKDGVMIINTSRGRLLDSLDAIEALKAGKIGALGLDVYENERELFFEDKSNEVIKDDVFRRLSACHNVVFTGHQAFLTEEALNAIADITFNNIKAFINHDKSGNELWD